MCYYSEIYTNVYIFCLERNEQFIKQLYYNKNIIIIVIPQIEHENCQLFYATPLNYINKYIKNLVDYDIIKSGNSFSDDGKIINEWEYMSVYGEFWKKFYHQVNLPYEIRYKYTNINRDYEREENLYNNIINIYGSKFIFFQDHRSFNYNHKGRSIILNRNILDDDIPIFHPNINFYENDKQHKFYNLWNENLFSNNLLDYCALLEKSEKIIIIDSSFSCLCCYLNLVNVKEKIVYSNLDLIDYHKNFKDWKIINI